MLTISRNIVDAIIAQARKDAPLETCGLLAGRGGRIELFYTMTNPDASPEHFCLLPGEQFFAQKDARRRGLQILGVVHSHPASLARPSQEDIRLANDPSQRYLILSLAQSEPVLKAFRIENASPQEVPIHVEPSDGRYGFLQIPDETITEIKKIRSHVEAFTQGRTDPVRFRAYRVPMGLYEQRQDGFFMARTRLPGGVADPIQLEKLAKLAQVYGKGILHFTTRQDIQLHDLPLTAVPAVMEELLSVGLVCRGGGGNTVRNITGYPLAGLDSKEPFDVLPYVLQASEHFLPHASSYNLPRKFKVAFVSAQDDRLAKVADLGFVAKEEAGRPGFAVWAGGGMGTHSRAAISIAEYISADEAVLYAEAAKQLFDQHGDRSNKHQARLRFVVQRLGNDQFKQLLMEKVAAIRCSLAGLPALRKRDFLALGGEILKEWPENVFPSVVHGQYHLRFRPFLGDITSQELRLVARLIQAHGLEFRADCDQGFYLAGVRGEQVAQIRSQLQQFLQPVPAAGPVACTGAATCRLGLCLSRGLAAAIRETVLSLPAAKQQQLPAIRISGCPNACGQHPIAELGFFGAAKRIHGRLMPFYNVVVPGNGLFQKLGDLPAKAVPEFVKRFESIAALPELLAQFQNYPAYEDAPDYYRDWGQTQDFSLAGRGPGECGAGVLDVIELDLKNAEEQLRHREDNDRLFQAAVAAMRALLIIRGVETQKPREIFDAFRQHLIEPGWVDGTNGRLIQKLLDFRLGDLASLQAETPAIASLVERIRELYKSLDGNLNFRLQPLPAEAGEPAKEKSEIRRMDLRGTPCPLNFVLAKLELEKIPKGGLLEVYLDEGEPFRNVPASFQDQGQSVESLRDAPDRGKSVVIRRRV